jgi:hypothetical protein
MVGYARVPRGLTILEDSCAYRHVYLGWNVNLFLCMGMDMNVLLVLNEYRIVSLHGNSIEIM